MDLPPAHSRLRSALQSRLQTGLRSRRWRVGVVVGLALVALLISGWVGLTRTQQAAANPCASASALGPLVAPLPPGAISPAPIPSGEPRIVATVNGDSITAEQLETTVQGRLANNRQTLAQMQQHAPISSIPSALLATLQETPNQARHDALTQIIQDTLLDQDGQRLGLTASPAAAQAQAREALQVAQSSSASNQAGASFAAYLRLNHLTPQSYASDPRVVCGYIHTLTITAVRQRVMRAASPDQSPTDAINAYVQHLWQTGNVHVYLPASLGW